MRKHKKIRLSDEDIFMYDKLLSAVKGLKEKAVELSGVSRFSYFNVMKGEYSKYDILQKVVSANLKVLDMQKNPNQASKTNDIFESLRSSDNITIIFKKTDFVIERLLPEVGIFDSFHYSECKHEKWINVSQIRNNRIIMMTIPVKIIKSIKVNEVSPR